MLIKYDYYFKIYSTILKNTDCYLSDRMGVGWARDGAVHEQIDASVEDAVELARSRLTEEAV